MAYSPVITIMVQAARKAARAIQRDFGEVENLQISIKGPGDFVTRADRKAEKTIIAELSKGRPTYAFLTEETGTIDGTDGQHCWVVDPIDGTTNFIHGIPHFAISIGLQRAGDMVAGVIYNPMNDELFTAERGRGAYLNDRRLRVAGRRDILDTVIACGVPHRGRGDLARFRRELALVQDKCSGIRRFGVASLDLAFVAAGRFDGFWERDLAPWDIAAGIVIVREAGGRIGELDGKGDPMKTGNILAANDTVYEQIQAELNKTARD